MRSGALEWLGNDSVNLPNLPRLIFRGGYDSIIMTEAEDGCGVPYALGCHQTPNPKLRLG